MSQSNTGDGVNAKAGARELDGAAATKKANGKTKAKTNGKNKKK